MTLYLIANNDLATNLFFADITNIETKKSLRVLNQDGIKSAKNLAKSEMFEQTEKIYSAPDAGSIMTSSYLANRLNEEVIVKNDLHDCVVGDLNGKSVKMLGYFQERDLNYKLYNGESLNECHERIKENITDIINDNYENIAVFLPKRSIFAYLLKYTKHGFNLDERMVLEYNDQVIMGDTESDLEIIKLTINNFEITNIELIVEKE
jgi:broad specificity phosphatase PhoE